jgi:hypothetical protein
LAGPAEELVIDAQRFRGEAGMANDFLGPRSGRPAGQADSRRTLNADFEEYLVRPKPDTLLSIALASISHAIPFWLSRRGSPENLADCAAGPC